MKKNRVANAFFSFCLLAGSANAQFIDYALYDLSPVFTNPASVANTDYKQVLMNYRFSRSANYNVGSASFIRPFFTQQGKRRIGGLGVSVITQNCGPGNILVTNGLLAGFAYNLPLNKNHFISLGIQGGLVNKRIDLSKLTSDSQYRYGAYDPSLPLNENFTNENASSVVINSGATWIWKEDNLIRAKVGVAGYNMNSPNYKFLDEDNRQDMKYVVTAETLLVRKGSFSLHPSLRWLNGGTETFTNIGVIGRYAVGVFDWNEISAGLWYKDNEAIVGNIQFTHPSYVIAVAYDLSLASYGASLNNAAEVCVGWRMNQAEKARNRK
jgi:type IX secretion system PorP/SprF family membrane protein